MPRLRLTYLLLDGRLFGGVNVTLEQARRLAARGHEVQILSIGPGPSWMKLDLPFRRVHAFSSATVPESDFVIGTAWPMARPAFEVGRGVPIQYCGGYEGSGIDPGSRRLQEIRAAYSLSTLKITSSRATEAFLREEFGSQVWNVPVAIDAEAFRRRGDRPRADGPPWRILLVGPGNVPAKGILAGLDAVRVLRDRGHDIEVVRVSPSPPTAAERETGLIDRWLGQVPPSNMPFVYHRAHLLLGPSRDGSGSFWMPGLEAMAAGVPAVLTDVPGHHEYAPGDGHALFVAPRDSAAMADAAERVLTDPALRARLVAAGQTIAARFSWDSHLDRLESVLAEIHAELGAHAMSRSCPVPGPSHPSRDAVHRAWYEFAATLVQGRRVLDVGCGTGQGSIHLARAGASEVLAVDRSRIAISHALLEHPDPRVSYHVMAPDDLAIASGAVDVVVAIGILDRLPDPERFLAGAKRVLNEQGALLVSLPNARNPLAAPRGALPPDPSLDFPDRRTVDDVHALLERWFGKVLWFRQVVEDGGITLRPAPFDPEHDLAYLALAMQPQRARPVLRVVDLGRSHPCHAALRPAVPESHRKAA